MKPAAKLLLLLLTGAALLHARTSFSLTLSNTAPCVGEPIVATFTLQSDHPIGDRDPFRPDFPGWWSTPMAEANITDDRHTIRWIYRLSPQHSGTLLLPPQSVATSHMDPRSYAITRTHHATRSRLLTVQALPAGTTIAGDFQLTEHLEHNTTRANSPATFTLILEGNGNIDDLPPFDLNLSDTLILTAPPTRRYRLKGNTLHARFEQHFTIVSDHTVTIPPITFRYFNTQTRVVQTLQTRTRLLDIKEKQIPFAKRWRSGFFGIGGFFLGLLAAGLWQLRKHFRRPQTPLSRRIRQARDDQTLYALLLPQAHRPEIRPYLKQLEANLYRNAQYPINRKTLINMLIHSDIV